MTATSERRRSALLLVEATKGNEGAAAALIRRTIKASGLAISSYVSKREAASYNLREARFTVECTDTELAALRQLGVTLAKADGWDIFPADIYHD